MIQYEVPKVTAKTFAHLSGLFVWASRSRKGQKSAQQSRMGLTIGKSLHDALRQIELELHGTCHGLAGVGAAKWQFRCKTNDGEQFVCIHHLMTYRPATPGSVIAYAFPWLDEDCREVEGFDIGYSGPIAENCVDLTVQSDSDLHAVGIIPKRLQELVPTGVELHSDACGESHLIQLLQIPDQVIESLPEPKAQTSARFVRDRVWAFTPGVNAIDRKPAIRFGRMVLGWGEVPDLRTLDDDQVRAALRYEYSGENDQSYRTVSACKQAVRMLRSIQKDIPNGEIIVLREGRRKIHAIGEVNGDYTYDRRNHGMDGFHNLWHSHQRPVSWWRVFSPGLALIKTVAESLLGDPPQAVETIAAFDVEGLLKLVKDRGVVEAVLRAKGRLQ